MPGTWQDTVRAEILPRVAPPVREALAPCLGAGPAWQELRLRAGRPLSVVTAGGEIWPGPGGAGAGPATALLVSSADLAMTLSLCADGSVYAWEAELAQGFLTLPGGHRVGVAGRVVWQHGGVRAVREPGSLNIRVAHPVPGAARALAHRVASGPRVRATLLYSPPGCGKTTVLRDLVRALSSGDGVPPRRVVVVDERMEIAACRDGSPQMDVGPRTDVLDGCPKHVGMALALRALGPEVLATDEIGREEDAEAILDAARSGVAVLATAHAADRGELLARPLMRRLLESRAFDLLVGLSRVPAPGTVTEVAETGGMAT